ncbi:hypothetical protein [Cesiribacter andamanensis]|uniref:Aldose 1-epimerase n=1 Tax=Cesiribacter andamanensis AMV16 TaxID=1279009 RepID=M7NGK2_9BACT|nr:hypothetical protein [Cesiribacter andamanensis]EMR00965.1 hypothetical protein ADICEAN_03907 [Cesiribacter andamanensis AMV16]
MQPSPPNPTPLRLQNASTLLEVDLWGGAITRFQLLPDGVNPLSFRFGPEQMPSNNQGGAPYQGHFLCLGRWGEPSEGEKAAGMPNHGQFANIRWEAEEGENEHICLMKAAAPLEGLRLQRRVQLDAHSAIFAVEEKVRNTYPPGPPLQHGAASYPGGPLSGWAAAGRLQCRPGLRPAAGPRSQPGAALASRAYQRG